MFKTLFLKPVRSMPAKVKMNVDGLDMDNIPKHVAIIMDGNGRWAKARGKVRTQGHKAGAETLKTIVRAADSLGIKAITAYAFSTENWKRPVTEVHFIMELLSRYLRTIRHHTYHGGIGSERHIERSACRTAVGRQLRAAHRGQG